MTARKPIDRATSQGGHPNIGDKPGGAPTVPPVIAELINRFEFNKETYFSARYNEAQLRREFIDPMFRDLGWDIDNAHGYADAYKDVIHEDSIKIGETSKAPDYAFRIGGSRKFFLEAKKPATNVSQDAESAYQLRRYAWSAKLPISILTNFRTFSVYDCRIKPEKSDKASAARIIHIQFPEYFNRWSDIASTFSREAILKGAFDRYAKDASRKRGTTEVDDAFLEDIEAWRETLSRNVHLRNKDIGTRDLNAAVQKTIDRIIFLRIAEDRGMEPYGHLRALKDGKSVYARLADLFRKADARYNSGLFHFRAGDGSAETLDTFTLGLTIDDAVLKRVLQSIYYPESPYEFSVLPADILGQIYERFLGKTIKIDGHRLQIEEKPEVKRAGGVYYTPTYIVRYIVAKTLGKLLQGRTVTHASGQGRRKVDIPMPLRVLDPACGSGSFLIEAYQFLLDWYHDQYVKDNPERAARGRSPVLHRSQRGGWQLTIAEKKRILLTHIFGVDVDPQAVEVTKLSLLLKVLEGESGDGLARQMDMFHTRPLPDLGANIRCGNSLIGPDFYSSGNLDLFDVEERLRINAFSWSNGFPRLPRDPKFDVIIGNPPYIFARELMRDHEKAYYRQHFKHSWDKQNTFMLFMEKVLDILARDGLASFIVPNSWLTIESAKLLRELYIPRLTTIVDMNYPAFQRVAMEPSIFVTRWRASPGRVETLRINQPGELIRSSDATADANQWIASGGRIHIDSHAGLANFLSKIELMAQPIGSAFDVRTGLQAYERGKGTPPQTARDVAEHVFDRTRRENEHSVRYLQGGDVARYRLAWSGMWMQYGPWLSQPREIGIFTRPRVLIREITAKLPHCICGAFVEEPYLSNKSVLTVLSYSDEPSELKCLLAILNSRPFSIFYKARAVKAARTVFPKLVINNLRELPYPKIISPKESAMLVMLADEITETEIKRTEARDEHQREALHRIAVELNQLIDAACCRLFGLDPDALESIEQLVGSDRAR